MNAKSIFVKTLKIKQFRGLSGLSLKECKKINLILGDNNCGKTSLFEAIQLLRNKTLSNVINIIENRKSLQISLTDVDFLCPDGSDCFEVSAETTKGEFHISLDKAKKNIIFNKNLFLVEDDAYKIFYENIIEKNNLDGKEVQQLNLNYKYNNETISKSFISLDFPFKRYFDSEENLNSSELSIEYLSPFIHFKSDELISVALDVLLKNDKLTKLFTAVLKIFEPRIERLMLFPSENYLVKAGDVFVKNVGCNPKPLSVYGDGMKKALMFAIKLIEAKDGILLIDEIETSLHYRCYKEIFSFIVKVAKQLNIQLFISTHSSEVIDTILDVISDASDSLNETKVFNLKQSEGKTLCREWTGEKAKNARKINKMEIRD